MLAKMELINQEEQVMQAPQEVHAPQEVQDHLNRAQILIALISSLCVVDSPHQTTAKAHNSTVVPSKHSAVNLALQRQMAVVQALHDARTSMEIVTKSSKWLHAITRSTLSPELKTFADAHANEFDILDSICI